MKKIIKLFEISEVFFKDLSSTSNNKIILFSLSRYTISEIYLQ